MIIDEFYNAICDAVKTGHTISPNILVLVRDEITRLCAIEASLDKTADGVAIVPGMKLYKAFKLGRHDSRGPEGTPYPLGEYTAVTAIETGDYYDPSYINGDEYSTQEAALKALENQ
jgi:hypothetical protein